MTPSPFPLLEALLVEFLSVICHFIIISYTISKLLPFSHFYFGEQKNICRGEVR
jgi:hypothetical protein